MMPLLPVLFLVMFIVGIGIAARVLGLTPKITRHITPRMDEMDWDAINDQVVQAALDDGNKIEAIKRYRLLTGQNLSDSKDAIEYAMLHPDERGDKKKKAAYDAQDAGIRDLIQEGRLDEAIEIYQKFAGVDACTARDAVNEIARDLHLSHRTASRTTLEVPPPDKSSHN